MELGLKASAISCPRALFCFFTRSFCNSINTSCHTNCCPKTEFFFSISADEKGTTYVFMVPANHSASFSFLHPVRRFLQATILTSVYPLLYPSGHRVQTSIGSHSDLDLLLRPRGIDLLPLFLF